MEKHSASQIQTRRTRTSIFRFVIAGGVLLVTAFWIHGRPCFYDKTSKTLEAFGSRTLNSLVELLDGSPCLKYVGFNLEGRCTLWNDELVFDRAICKVKNVSEKWANASLCSVWIPGAVESRVCFESSPKGDHSLIDLSVNPERYTGYSGQSSQRAWYWIYKTVTGQQNSENIYDSKIFEYPEHLTLERQYLYRIVSGLHASISTHLSYEYFYPELGTFGPNPNLFDRLVGSHPQRKQNLYLCAILLISALIKTGPETFEYGLGSMNHAETSKTIELLTNIQTKYRTCKCLLLDKELEIQAQVLHEVFNGLYKVTDCLGCELCRLWGKVQILGIWTGLRILFGLQNLDPLDPSDPDFLKSPEHLSRTEILTFLWTLRRFLESILYLQNFEKLLHIRPGSFV